MLVNDGIFSAPDVFDVSIIDEINARLDPLFLQQVGLGRSYVRADSLFETGAFDLIFHNSFRDLIFAIMPDPVIYHCHAYEIAGNTKRSHIFSDRLLGFHADPDSKWTPSEPTHISIFVYLSDVSADDGAFEFVVEKPSRFLRSNSGVATMTGTADTTFAWNRCYYHRASPNAGNTRRRLFKLSIQRNRFPSSHLETATFQRLKALIPAGSDVELDQLLGRNEGRVALQFGRALTGRAEAVKSNRTLGFSARDLVKENVMARAKGVARSVIGSRGAKNSYD